MKQAYDEFVPLDGRFRANVLVQVKNGPLDFQPREPFNPLFGAMPQTPLMAELQITQEYLGQSTHLVYLAPMWKEVLDADTYARRARLDRRQGRSTAACDGHRAHRHRRRGQHRDRPQLVRPRFGQANWYAFGRLAWDPRPVGRGHRGRVDRA